MALVKYKEVKFPFSPSEELNKRSLKQVDEFFEWFNLNYKKRLNYFLKYSFSDQEINFDKKTLQALNYLFESKLKTEDKSEQELKIEYDELPAAIKRIHKLKQYKFIEPTFSLTFDISLFMGEMMIKEIPDFKWDIERNVEYAKYGYPMLKSNKHYLDFCPLWLLETARIKIIEKKAKETIFVDLFEIWLKDFVD